MIISVLRVATFSLCIALTVALMPSSVLAGNSSSHPTKPPAYSPVKSLEEILTEYNVLMGTKRLPFLEQFGTRTEKNEKGIMQYEFPREGASATFFGEDDPPMGIVYKNPGLQKYTLADVKKLLGKPNSEKVAEDGTFQISYNPVENSTYLGKRVDFKFEKQDGNQEGAMLLRMAFLSF